MPEPNAIPMKGCCPDCGTPLRRYAAIGKGLAVVEKAVLCPKCKAWSARHSTFGVTSFTAAVDPRRVKTALADPVKAPEVKP